MPEPAPTPGPSGWQARRRGVLVAGLVAALVLTVGGAVAFVRRAPTETAAQPPVDAAAQAATPTTAPTTTPSPSATPSPSPVVPVAPSADAIAPGPRGVSCQDDPPASAANGGGDPQDALPADSGPATSPAAAAPARPRTDGEACFATAVDGGLVLGANRQHNAGGPNFTTDACGSIHIKLYSAVYRTYARSCLETASGSSITSCSGWILLSYPDTWDTLSRNVPGGTRWQIQMYAEGPEQVSFYYTA